MGAALLPHVLARPRVAIAVVELPVALEIAACALVLAGGICRAAMRPIREPYRALVYRMATLHRVAGPGYIWLVPLLERIEAQISLAEHEVVVFPAGVRTADGHLLKMRLEVAWRLAPSIRGCPGEEVRHTLLLPDERRAKLVEEAITRAAMRAVGACALGDLSATDARDEAVAALTREAHGALEGKGIEVMRVFWRL